MKGLLYISILFTSGLLSCNSKSDTPPSPPTDSTNTIKRRVIKQGIAVADSFFQITNISSATVDFSTGPMSITAEGDSSSLSHLSYDFDGGILTISTPMDIDNDLPTYPVRSDVVVHVSCPVLNAMAICSGGGFRCRGKLETDKLQLGGMVSGEIDIDTIECNTFRYESNGSTVTNIRHISCDESYVISTGDGTINTGVEAKSLAYFDIKGNTTIASDIKSKKSEHFIDTGGSVAFNVDTDELEVHALSGTISLKGKTNHQNIKCSSRALVHNELK